MSSPNIPQPTESGPNGFLQSTEFKWFVRTGGFVVASLGIATTLDGATQTLEHLFTMPVLEQEAAEHELSAVNADKLSEMRATSVPSLISQDVYGVGEVLSGAGMMLYRRKKGKK